MAGCMLSFGGYNGRYHNAVHVYRPEGYVVVRAPASAAVAVPHAPHAPHAPQAAANGTTHAVGDATATVGAVASADYDKKVG